MMTLSSPGFARKEMPAPSLRFQGEAEYKKYVQMMKDYPADSVARLAQIKRNEKNEGKKHIMLAIWHGLRDNNIHVLNQEIQRLLKVRNGQRTVNPPASEEAREHLGNLRDAIVNTLQKNGYDPHGNKLDVAG